MLESIKYYTHGLSIFFIQKNAKSNRKSRSRSRSRSLTLYRPKSDRDIQSWSYSNYQAKHESEYLTHFYLKYVYIPPGISLEDFLNFVRNRVSRAATPAFIRILAYKSKYSEVHISVGMKYDHDAK